jgi:hypothetical protein
MTVEAPAERVDAQAEDGTDELLGDERGAEHEEQNVDAVRGVDRAVMAHAVADRGDERARRQRVDRRQHTREQQQHDRHGGEPHAGLRQYARHRAQRRPHRLLFVVAPQRCGHRVRRGFVAWSTGA